MLQTEIWYADLNPAKGSKQAGYRPIVIVSGNLANQYLNTVICCPLTTKLKNNKGNIILKPNFKNKLEKESEVLTFHIRSISKKRLVSKIGNITDSELAKIKLCFDEIWRY